MHRLFVALRPPPAMRRILAGTMLGVEQARWQSDEQLHLTMRFIGEVDRHQAEDVAAALGRVSGPAPEVAIAGVGAFGSPGRPNSLWAGVPLTAELARIHASIDSALHAVGIPRETRAFRPHVTVARLGRDAGATDAWLAVHAGLQVPAATIDHLILFESSLGHGDAIYEAIARYPLDRP